MSGPAPKKLNYRGRINRIEDEVAQLVCRSKIFLKEKKKKKRKVEQKEGSKQGSGVDGGVGGQEKRNKGIIERGRQEKGKRKKKKKRKRRK